MKPIINAKSQYMVKTIAEPAGHKIADLPKWNSVCYQWILGWCAPTELDATKCRSNTRMNHPVAADIPDDFATNLATMLQPGVDKFIQEKK